MIPDDAEYQSLSGVLEVREYSTHDMFIAEVVTRIVLNLWMRNGSYDFGRTNLIAFNHGGYYNLDDQIWRFAFVMKEKTKRRKEKEARGIRRQQS